MRSSEKYELAYQVKPDGPRERALMAAVFLNTMRDIERGGDRRKEAYRYFMHSEHESAYPFSFKAICWEFDMEPGFVRQALLKIYRRQRGK